MGMGTNSCLSCKVSKGLLFLGAALAMVVGLAPSVTRAAGGPDKLVSAEEFSALFEPDPAEAPKTRGLAKVPRPSFESKKREATTYILFETGSILLKTPASFDQMDIAGQSFKKAVELGQADKWVIEIAGHTDNVGSPESNLKLSQERAEAVRQYLLQSYGLPPQLVIAQGYGDRQPVASNDAPEGREKNRRVVFRVTQRAAAVTP